MQRLSWVFTAVTAIALSGCGTAGLFSSYDLPEGEGVAEAPWPRLIDVPEATPPGTYSEDIPDPAIGIAAESSLRSAAADGARRAAQLTSPVLSDR
ncbi:MAG: hypothetical protein AAGF44_10310, partial [Pseudomonadota bacterium]